MAHEHFYKCSIISLFPYLRKTYLIYFINSLIPLVYIIFNIIADFHLVFQHIEECCLKSLQQDSFILRFHFFALQLQFLVSLLYFLFLEFESFCLRFQVFPLERNLVSLILQVFTLLPYCYYQSCESQSRKQCTKETKHISKLTSLLHITRKPQEHNKEICSTNCHNNY